MTRFSLHPWKRFITNADTPHNLQLLRHFLPILPMPIDSPNTLSEVHDFNYTIFQTRCQIKIARAARSCRNSRQSVSIVTYFAHFCKSKQEDSTLRSLHRAHYNCFATIAFKSCTIVSASKIPWYSREHAAVNVGFPVSISPTIPRTKVQLPETA